MCLRRFGMWSILVERKCLEIIQPQSLGVPQNDWAGVYVIPLNLYTKAHLFAIRRRHHPDWWCSGCMDMLTAAIGTSRTLKFPQDKLLYVSDPKALYHIVVKVSGTGEIVYY
jgi:hypothetical protein